MYPTVLGSVCIHIPWPDALYTKKFYGAEITNNRSYISLTYPTLQQPTYMAAPHLRSLSRSTHRGVRRRCLTSLHRHAQIKSQINWALHFQKLIEFMHLDFSASVCIHVAWSDGLYLRVLIWLQEWIPQKNICLEEIWLRAQNMITTLWTQ